MSLGRPVINGTTKLLKPVYADKSVKTEFSDAGGRETGLQGEAHFWRLVLLSQPDPNGSCLLYRPP